MENATPGTQLARKLSGLSTNQPGSHGIAPAATNAIKKAMGAADRRGSSGALWNSTNAQPPQPQPLKQHGSESAAAAAASPMSDVKAYGGRPRSAFSSRGSGTPPPMISSELLAATGDTDDEASTPKQAEAPPIFVDTMESPPQFLIRSASAPTMNDADALQHPELQTAQAPTHGLLHRPVAIRGVDGWLTNQEATQTQKLLPSVALGRAASADPVLAPSSSLWHERVAEESGNDSDQIGADVVITPTREGAARPRRRSSRSSARRGRSLSLSFGANGAGGGVGLSRSHNGNFPRPSSLHMSSSSVASDDGPGDAGSSSPSAPAVKRPSTSSSPSMQHRTRFSVIQDSGDAENVAPPAGSVITAESKRRRTTSSDDERNTSTSSLLSNQPIELMQGGIPSTEEVFLASDANVGGGGGAAATMNRRRSARSKKKAGSEGSNVSGARSSSDPGPPKRAGAAATAAAASGGFPRRGTISGASGFGITAAAVVDRTKAQRRPSAPRVGLLPDGPNVRGDRLKECILPTTGTHHKHHTSVRLVTSETVSKLINGAFSNIVDGYVIVDCRFPFEYQGGHINTAVNFWTMERTVANFLHTPIIDITSGARIPIIFHCEFSSVRAPTMFKYLRDLDNEITFGNPNLIYPELYVMEKGYEKFYAEHPDDCTPRQYIRMKDKRYAADNEQCENILSRSREEASQKKWVTNSTVQTLNALVKEHGMEGLGTVKLQRPGSPTPGEAGRRAPRTPSTPMSQILA